MHLHATSADNWQIISVKTWLHQYDGLPPVRYYAAAQRLQQGIPWRLTVQQGFSGKALSSRCTCSLKSQFTYDNQSLGTNCQLYIRSRVVYSPCFSWCLLLSTRWLQNQWNRKRYWEMKEVDSYAPVNELYATLVVPSLLRITTLMPPLRHHMMIHIR